VIAMQLNQVPSAEFWHDEKPRERGKGGFPLVAIPGTESVGVVYFEIEPGNSLGMHTDSPDEVIVVLTGTACATIGEETGELSAGGLAFIPGMVPHGFENVGDETLRCVGIFPDSNVVSTFDYVLQPFGTRVLKFKDLVPAQV
jgi:quercetin dioxygenase-like cupin family protein